MDDKQKIYLTLIISIIIIIGLLLFLIHPLVGKVKTASADLIEKNSLISSYEEKSSDYLQWLRDEYVNIESEKISEISGSFIDSEKVIDFILAVEQIAALTGNYQEIKEVSSLASPIGGSEEGGILSFQVSLWGNFPNLIKFLAQLENTDYFIDSDSIQITKIGARDLRSLADKGIVISAGGVRSVINIKVYTK